MEDKGWFYVTRKINSYTNPSETNNSSCTSNTSGNLLNEIHQILQSLYAVKEVTKKVYNNIINVIKL